MAKCLSFVAANKLFNGLVNLINRSFVMNCKNYFQEAREEEMKANKILVTIFALVCLSAVVLTGCSTEKKYVPYENKDLQFKISIPEDWQKEENHENGTNGVAFGDPSSFSLAITAAEAPDGLTLEDSTAALVEGYKSMPGFTQVKEDKIELGKAPASKFVFTGKMEDEDMKCMIINTIKNKKAYVVLYMAIPDQYDTNLPDIEEAIKSFEFTE
ncbi:hypothetical protein [Desulforamulus ruminis]|uniref:hypothetical protein n=1 Tax=Desulforamulus ruminis TaxID=1564 RepID=UPI0023520C0B|nr:hypothetical protein [Desulforamulus ruminis]